MAAASFGCGEIRSAGAGISGMADSRTRSCEAGKDGQEPDPPRRHRFLSPTTLSAATTTRSPPTEQRKRHVRAADGTVERAAAATCTASDENDLVPVRRQERLPCSGQVRVAAELNPSCSAATAGRGRNRPAAWPNDPDSPARRPAHRANRQARLVVQAPSRAGGRTPPGRCASESAIVRRRRLSAPRTTGRTLRPVSALVPVNVQAVLDDASSRRTRLSMKTWMSGTRRRTLAPLPRCGRIATVDRDVPPGT